MRAVFLLLLFASCSCVTIPYSNDTAFLNSSQANSPELFVKVNGKVCSDLDGNIGLCAKSVKTTEDLVLYQPPSSYAYRFILTCTDSLGINTSQDIPAGVELNYTIPSSKYNIKQFICIGDIYPMDRKDQLSAFWKIVVNVVDAAYTPKSDIYQVTYNGNDYLILGQDALWSRIYQNGKWKRYGKKTVLQIKNGDTVKAESESYMMRFSYLNYTF